MEQWTNFKVLKDGLILYIAQLGLLCLVCGLVGSRIGLSFAHSIVHTVVCWVIGESFSHVLSSCSPFFQQYGAWNVHMEVVDTLIVESNMHVICCLCKHIACKHNGLPNKPRVKCPLFLSNHWLVSSLSMPNGWEIGCIH